MIMLWEEIFRVEGIGIDDDFFSLGGDSIVSIRLVSRATKEGLRLETLHLFECYTVRKIFDKYGEVLCASDELGARPPQTVVSDKPWQERFPEVSDVNGVDDVYHMTPVQEGLFGDVVGYNGIRNVVPQFAPSI
jgi:hypothetical protein